MKNPIDDDADIKSNNAEIKNLPIQMGNKKSNESVKLPANCTYGFEYIIEDVLQEKSGHDSRNRGIDWFGISDLTPD